MCIRDRGTVPYWPQTALVPAPPRCPLVAQWQRILLALGMAGLAGGQQGPNWPDSASVHCDNLRFVAT
eukprot:1037852-Karenia_brevis.AAC.1